MEHANEEMYKSTTILRLDGGAGVSAVDEVVVEEPLEVRLKGQSFAVTMCTPGQDQALAVGFLVTEGIVRGKSDIWDIQHCASDANPDSLNIIEVSIPPEHMPEVLQTGRQRYSNSSCGICGK